MFKNLCIWSILITFYLFTTFSSADVSNSTVDKIMDLSGLTKQVHELPKAIKLAMAQAKQQGTPISERDHNLMLMSIDETILANEILSGIRSSIKKSINEDEAKNLLAWFESSLGRKITTAEENGSTAEAVQNMAQQAESLFADSEKVAFAKRLDALVGATDMAMDMQELTGLAVYTALMSVMQPDAPLNLEAYKAELDATADQTRAALEQWVILSFVYSYKDIDSNSLDEYEEFLNKPYTTKFNKIVIDSMNEELESSIINFAKTLAIKLGKNTQQS